MPTKTLKTTKKAAGGLRKTLNVHFTAFRNKPSGLTPGHRFDLQKLWKLKETDFLKILFSIMMVYASQLRQYFIYLPISHFSRDASNDMYNNHKKSNTKFEPRPMSWLDPNGSGCIPVDSSWTEHHGITFKPFLSCFDQKLLVKINDDSLVTVYSLINWPFEVSLRNSCMRSVIGMTQEGTTLQGMNELVGN